MWRVSHRVHFPTLALGVLWIVHSLATTLYVPWQNRRQRGALEERLVALHLAVEIERDAAVLQSVVGPKIGFRDTSESRAELIARAEQLRARERDRRSAELLAELVKRVENIEKEMSSTNGAAGYGEVADLTRCLVVAERTQLLEVVDQRSRTDLVVMAVRAVLLVLGLLVGIGLAMWMARGLQRSLTRLGVSLRGAEGAVGTDLGTIEVVADGPPEELAAIETQVQKVVSNLRRVGDELQRTRQEMVRAERLAAVGEVAAGVAHEIRNPLTSVKLLVQTAAERGPDHPLGPEQLGIVLDEVSRMERTVQGLLDFARPEKPRRIEFALDEVLASTLLLLEGRMRQRGGHIQCRGDRTVQACGDPGMVQQVLVNLIINAVESIGDGGAILLDVEREPDDSLVAVRVLDDGPGIPAESLERIFEPFVTTRATGAGLGLAISRRLAEEQGGTLTARNLPGGGACFTLHIPAA